MPLVVIVLVIVIVIVIVIAIAIAIVIVFDLPIVADLLPVGWVTSFSGSGQQVLSRSWAWSGVVSK